MNDNKPLMTVGIFNAIFKQWKLGLLVFVAGVALAAPVIMQLPNTYRARAALAVRSPFPNEEMREAVPRLDESVNSLRVRLMARPILLGVARESGLFTESLQVGPEEIAGLFRSNLSITEDGDRAFLVSLRGGDPEKIAHALNLLLQQFTENDQNYQLQLSQANVASLNRRLEQTGRRLDELNEQVLKFKEDNSGSLPEEVTANIALLAQANERLIIGSTTEIRESREANRNLELMEADAMGRLAALQARYHNEHPDVARAQRTLSKISEMRKGAGKLMLFSPDPTIARGMARKARGIEQKLARVPVVADQLSVLNEQRRILIAQQEGLNRQVDHALLEEEMAASPLGGTFRVVENAQVPLAAESPNRPFLLLVAALLSLAAAFAAAVAKEATRRTMRNSQEVSQALGTHVLASIPNFKPGKGGKQPKPSPARDPSQGQGEK